MRRLFFVVATPTMLAISSFAMAENSSDAAADLREQPVTQSLNSSQATQAHAEVSTTTAQQDQYELDRAAFRAEVAARREKIMSDDIAYERQQRAYADAMAAWRIQTDECKRGILKSCKKPTPVPADYYRP